LDGTYSLRLQRSNTVANTEIRQGGMANSNLPSAYYEQSSVEYNFLFEYTANNDEGTICNFLDTMGRFKAALHLDTSGNLLFYGSTQFLCTGTTAVTPNERHMITAKVGTGSNASWEIDLDGARVMGGSADLGSMPTSNNGSLELGGNSPNNDTYYYDNVEITADPPRVEVWTDGSGDHQWTTARNW